MQINHQSPNFNAYTPEGKGGLEKFKDKITASAKEITNGYFLQFQSKISSQTSQSLTLQSALFADENSFKAPQNLSEILQGLDYDFIGYKGKEIANLSKEEASNLISDDGFFGIANTAKRIADFVIIGGGDDLGRLKMGREGVMRGFEEAKKIWGGELPEISLKTIEKTLKNIDEHIANLGGNVLNVKA